MSFGNPVVFTGIGAAGIVCKPGTDIFIADDANTFAGEVIALLNDKNLVDLTRQKARQLASSVYHWQMIGHTVNEKIKRLLALAGSVE
jgi:glycosyltransferase involved in cell wall biosynthesis